MKAFVFLLIMDETWYPLWPYLNIFGGNVFSLSDWQLLVSHNFFDNDTLKGSTVVQWLMLSPHTKNGFSACSQCGLPVVSSHI